MSTTQQDCRDRFIEATKAFAAILRSIDLDTPATPTAEPTWWLAMSDLERKVHAVLSALNRVQP